MTLTKTYCDHCGKELNLKEDYDDTAIETPTNYFNVDLCIDCCREINTIIKDFISKGNGDNNV